MAQTSQFGTPAKVAVGAVIVAVVGLAAYFMQPTSDAAAPPVVAEMSKDAPKDAPKLAPSAEPILPTLDVVRVTPEGEATIAGRAAPDAKVSLRVDGTEIASAPADGAGAYASLFSLPTSDKVRILTVAATGADGVEVLGKDQVVLAPTIVPPLATTEPTTTSTPEPTTAPTPAPLKITEAGVQVLEPAELVDTIVINSITYAGDLVNVGGLGQAEQDVRLYVDGAAAGSAKIAANGTWSATLDQIAPGVYTLRADQLGPDGQVTSRYETPFKRESSESLAAAIPAPKTTDVAPTIAPSTVTVQPGLTLWAIAQENFGAGTMYVQVFEANKDQIRDPNLIYPGQVFTIPKAQ